MGKTFRRNDGRKKNRRDRNFRKSKKFKDQQSHQHSQKFDEKPPEEDYDNSTDNF